MTAEADSPVPDCPFCRIVAGLLPSSQVYSDSQVVAFRDRNPAAPVHVLVVPRRHISGINVPEAADGALLAALSWSRQPDRRSAKASPKPATGWSGTSGPMPARAFSTFISTSWADVDSVGRRDDGGQSTLESLDTPPGIRYSYELAGSGWHRIMREWLRGRASPCQGEGRGFESRLPLH